jgi:hypothetical protein
MDDQSKAHEEAKRWAAQDPAERWRQILAMIEWAELQLPPEQRRNRPRVHPSQSRAARTAPA